MSSCVKPLVQSKEPPVVLLHGFDRCLIFARDEICLRHFMIKLSLNFHAVLLFSSCLEWRYGYPLLEESGFETWAVDILGWGFSDLGLFYYFAYCILFVYPFLFEVFYAFNSNFSFIHQKIFLLVTWYQSAVTFTRLLCFLSLNASLVSLCVYQTLYHC